MAVTLSGLVQQVQGHLNQFVVNRPRVGTFVGWSGADPVTGVELADFTSPVSDQIVELVTGELLHIKQWDATTGGTTVLPWFRGFNDTPLVDTVPANSMAVVNPLWPRYAVAQKVCLAIGGLYPRLFGVKETTLDSSAVNGNYLLPSDVDGVLRVEVEGWSPGKRRDPVTNWHLDVTNQDGNRYLRTSPSWPGRPVYVTYKAKPVVPDPANFTATWDSTGLPASAADLPVLLSVSQLVASVDASKLAMSSLEQSDQNRLIQGGSASSVSRRFEEMYSNRLAEEQRKLPPPAMHKDRII